MHRNKLMTRLVGGSAAAFLAFGAVACEVDDNGDLDPGQEAPEGDFEGEGDLEGDGFEDEGEGDF